MPVHDWTQVNNGVFHDFHYSWVLEIKRALQRGLLPNGYYVMAEQIGGDLGAPDVLTLQSEGSNDVGDDDLAGTATLTEAPPKTDTRMTLAVDAYARLQRTLVIRYSSGDRIVAMIEVVSRGNKSSRHAVRSFVDKAAAALTGGVHLLLIDVHPPGPRDPNGLHGLLCSEIGSDDYTLPRERLLTVASYIAGVPTEAFVNHFAIGDTLPETPLFLTAEHYIRVPLESSYLAAWDDVPPQYRAMLGEV